MANIKSQKKRIITAEKARKRNQAVKSELKTAVRAVREAVAAGNGVEATPRLSMLAVCSTRLLPRVSSTRTRLPTASLASWLSPTPW